MARFKNLATGEVYELGFDIEPGESIREVAWGRALRVACEVNSWNIHDVKVLN